MNTWPRVCGCGRSIPREEWDALPLVGHMDDDVERLQLKNCPTCDSTIAIFAPESTEEAACAPTNARSTK